MHSEAREIARRFESGDVDAAAFDHREHVVAGWAMLECYPFLDAVIRFANALRDIAAAAGDAEKYNTTITVAFMALIAERINGETYRDADDFCARNTDLLESSILGRYYDREELLSEAYRAAFVLPQ